MKRVRLNSLLPFTFSLLLAVAYILLVSKDIASAPEKRTDGQVVIAAPMQQILFAGDRYLASNIEAIRAATITLDELNDEERFRYRLRSHKVVSQLNPCHEDNYYLGNAILSWGGMQEQGIELLKLATNCRTWDEYPPFFLGFNLYFFYRDTEEAAYYLEVAAKRASKNSAALRKLSIMIRAEQLNDENMAIEFLRDQYKKTEDPKLKAMLDKRIIRLNGLLRLRKAQDEYENQTGMALQHPSQLLENNIIETYPEDPLRLGYEFNNGVFQLKQLNVRGLEEYK